MQEAIPDFQDNEIIMDSIYGIVKISSFEKRLLGTPEMQRLRRIKQLGFVNLVYPGAEHSRFVHSIGACHQAKRLVDQINLNLKREKRYRAWRLEGKNHKNEIKKDDNALISHAERVVISAAALLHDLPHSPFSHEIESPTSEHNKGIPSHDDFIKNPALFKYLFDTKNSKLAEIIRIYNSDFWKLLNSDIEKKWIKEIENRWPELITIDGMLPVNATNKASINKFPIQGKKNCDINELPILGIMIFELHLFDKPKYWVTLENGKEMDEEPNGIEVVTDWNSSVNNLNWRPLYGWFRPYRKDIIGNTICADLIDYIERDGKNTGITSQLDLKFLDRMTITRAIYSKDGATNLSIRWGNIPWYCEHVVFDIYDHKRGFIRQSIITEILSCLHSRYLLGERVYNHRVVEGARSMLQEVSRLLCSAGVLSPENLHSCNLPQEVVPTGDETFLSWVLTLKDNGNDDIKTAKKLVKHIQDRRIYREAVIIDGIHGFEIPGSMAGPEENCKSLVNALLSDEKREQIINKINRKLREELIKEKDSVSDDIPNLLATVGVREFGKRYKIPNVLISKPLRAPNSNGHWPLEIQPLFACQDPPHIKDQLDAMKTAYDSLWRVYLFIHPLFHCQKHEALHESIKDIFLEYVNKETNIKWHNSIDFTQLLSEEPLDIVTLISEKGIIISDKKAEQKRDAIIIDFSMKALNVSYKRLYDTVSEGGKEPYSNDVTKLFRLISGSNEIMEIVSDKINQSKIIKEINVWDPNEKETIAARDDEGPIEFIFKKLKEIVLELKKQKKIKKSKTDDGQPGLL